MTVRTRFAPSPTVTCTSAASARRFPTGFSRDGTAASSFCGLTIGSTAELDEALQPILDGLLWLGSTGTKVRRRAGRLRRTTNRNASIATSGGPEVVADGYAYYDYATTEEIQAERTSAEKEKRQFRYSRRFMAETPGDRARFERGRQAVVRLKCPPRHLVLDDVSRPSGVRLGARTGHVIQRADGTCLYHLANVVDDYDFQITHVIRAEEHLSNSRGRFSFSKRWLSRPVYAHLPFVAEPGSRNKLSKRKLDKYLKNRDFAQLVEHAGRSPKRSAMRGRRRLQSGDRRLLSVDRISARRDRQLHGLLGWSLDDKTEHSPARANRKVYAGAREQSPASFDPKN